MQATLTRDKAALRTQYEQADAEIGRTLSLDAAAFKSAAELRNQFNEARTTREWASRQLAALEHGAS